MTDTYENGFLSIRQPTPTIFRTLTNHTFSVTFFGSEVRKLYKFEKNTTLNSILSIANQITTHYETVNDRIQIGQATIQSPLFNVGDTVYVPKIKSDRQITKISRSIEDGSYQIFVGPACKVIEDEKTEESLKAAQQEQEKYLKKIAEENEKEKEKQAKLHDLLLKQEAWNMKHHWIYKHFNKNPYDSDPRIIKFEKESERIERH